MAVKRLPPHIEAILESLPESGTVTVGCKLPNGIHLRLFEMKKTEELVMGGGVRSVDRAFLADHEPVLIEGNSVDRGPNARPKLLIGGYAFTHNVDAQFFREWVKQNYDSDLLKNRCLFAQETRDAVEGQAHDQAEILSGLQPLNKSEDGGDIRDPNRKKVQTAELSTAA